MNEDDKYTADGFRAAQNYQDALDSLHPQVKRAFDAASVAMELIQGKTGGKTSIESVQLRIMSSRVNGLEKTSRHQKEVIRLQTKRIWEMRTQLEDMQVSQYEQATKISLLEDRYDQLCRDMLSMRRDFGIEGEDSMGSAIPPKEGDQPPKEDDKRGNRGKQKQEEYNMKVPDMLIDDLSQEQLRMHLKAPVVELEALPGLIHVDGHRAMKYSNTGVLAPNPLAIQRRPSFGEAMSKMRQFQAGVPFANPPATEQKPAFGDAVPAMKQFQAGVSATNPQHSWI